MWMNISILFLVTFCCLSAQTEIAGRVLDAQIRKPVISPSTRYET